MMSTRRLITMTTILLLAAYAFVSPAAGSGPKDKVTPFVLETAVLLSVVDGPAHDTGGGSVFHDTVYTWDITASDPRMNGIYTIHFDVGLSKETHPTPYWGPAHGVWSMDANGDGVPEWQGVFHVMPQTDDFVTHYSGDGAGIYEGLKVTMGDHDGTFTGEIFDPKAR